MSELLKVALEFGLVTEFTMGIMRENIRSHATSKLTLFKITSTHFALFVRSVFFFLRLFTSQKPKASTQTIKKSQA